jgi:AcrR family transcriptional regulator
MSGRRESKKRQTREAIARAAAELFRAHGFDAVSVQQVARQAGVSRQTVFNYFPTKEDMLFDRDAEMAGALLAAVRERGRDTSLVDAYRAHTRAFWTRLDAVLREGPLPHGSWEIVRSHPPLRDRAEARFARHALVVGEQLATERNLPPDDPICQAVARALGAVDSGMLMAGLDRLCDGEPPATVVAEVISTADGAYDLLRDGLADW